MKRLIPLTALMISLSVPAFGAEITKSIDARFSAADTKEVPDFRRHMSPLMGKLGCNGRACHGSFQGRGGFHLSLFGHDFDVDHKAMTAGKEPRVDLKNPNESLIVAKPLDGDFHEGGQRFKKGSWEHTVFRRWIEGGAKNVEKGSADFVKLDITPKEIIFKKKNEKVQLKVVAVWSDGAREDVTTLCRFYTNSSTNAAITESGLITSGQPGDTNVVVSYDKGVVPIAVLQPVSEFVAGKYPKTATPTKVDELVIEKLKKLGIVQSDVASDVEFLRRVGLDMVGTLPTPNEVKRFLADPSPDKRSRKIDELLKTPAYAAWWTTKICDFTGNNDEKLNNVVYVRSQPASVNWYDWVHKRVKENTPYDDLVEGIVVSKTRNEGEDFTSLSKNLSKVYHKGAGISYAETRETMPHYWARNNFRTGEERVIGFAYTFLGIRIQCAQCHKHPFDQWTQVDFKKFTPFFTNTRFGTVPGTKGEYDAMVEKLELGDLRGGQQRRAIGQAAEKGKVVPFREVYTTASNTQKNTNGRKKRAKQALKKLTQQITVTKEQIEKFKANGNQAALKKAQKRLAGFNKQLKRLNAQAKRAKAQPTATVAQVLGGEAIDLTKHKDPRQPLMDWMRSKDNPFFAKAFVNRVWASYFNVGIVNPPDDLSLANPPSNAPLLDYLAKGFIESGFDMKWLHREIANSRTYQLSWVPNDTNRADETNFSHAIARRLPAEVAYDAVKQATSSDAKIEEMHKDLAGRAITIPGADSRNRGRNPSAYALSVFGRSIRESNCDCDRSSEASLLQTVFMQNDSDVLSMIDQSRTGWLDQVARELGTPLQNNSRSPRVSKTRAKQIAAQVAAGKKRLANLQKQIKQSRKNGNKKQIKPLQAQVQKIKKRIAAAGKQLPNSAQAQAKTKKVDDMDSDAIVNQAYLRTLSRYPSEDELARSKKYIQDSDDTVNGIRGLLWALLNTKEFIVNH